MEDKVDIEWLKSIPKEEAMVFLKERSMRRAMQELAESLANGTLKIKTRQPVTDSVQCLKHEKGNL